MNPPRNNGQNGASWHLYSVCSFSPVLTNTVPFWSQAWFSFGEGNGTPLQYFCLENPMDGEAWWAAVHGVAKSRIRLSIFTFTFHFHALKKEMATHSSVLAWRIPGTGEPGGLPSLGSHRVGHNWSDLVVVVVVGSHFWSESKFTPPGDGQAGSLHFQGPMDREWQPQTQARGT